MKKYRLLICNTVLIIAVFCIYFLQKRIERFEGFDQNFILIVWPALLIVPFLIYALIAYVLVRSEKLYSLYVFISAVAFTLLFQVFIHDSMAVYKHFQNAVVIRNNRYEVEDIDLYSLKTIGKKDCLVYIGRPSCNQCVDAEKIIKNIMSDQPVRVYYYNTEKDRKNNREEMIDLLNNYSVYYVPAILFFVDGRLDRILYYDQIESNLGEIIHVYKMDNIYFTR